MKIVSGFEVTGWDATPYGEQGEAPFLSEAHAVKRYRGDLDGEGRVRLLMCRASRDGPRRTRDTSHPKRSRARSPAVRDVRSPTLGVAGAGAPPRTAGHVVPGSGTGELSGLSGTMEIHVDADGEHTLALDFEIV